MPSNQLLTFSRTQDFKTCRKRHWWAYEIGIRQTLDAKALRMGTAYHAGLHALKLGEDLDIAAEAVRERYRDVPIETDQQGLDWDFECETVVAMVSGYAWRWESSALEVVASEQVFQLPLLNPETNSPSHIFNLAGRIDGIVKLEDGRLAVLEHKLQSDDIAPESDYWRRLQLDHQITLYVYAARHLGHNVSTVLYDVARKPTIRPEKVPILDDEGLKVVLDANGNRVCTKDGKKWRETGDSAQGYVLQSRPMTCDEWIEKLLADMASRAQVYYARQEIVRLDADISDFLAEMWDIQKTIRDAQLRDRWFRTVSRDGCTFCPYFGLCTSRFNPRTGLVPDGFQYVEDKHPELKT